MRVLVAEDDPTSRRMIEAMLGKWGYDVETVADGEKALEALLAGDGPPLAVLDRLMPGLDGAEVCREVRAREKGTGGYTYLVILTVKGSKEDIISGMEAGADDYIAKPFDDQELRVRVSAGRRIIELQSELRKAKDFLFNQSRTDSLTGIFNRRAILSELQAEMSRCKREGKSLSVACFDVDHFKAINDAYGHAAGDEVLIECVRRISSTVRPYDKVGRTGGEEFLITLPGADEQGAASTCGRILGTVGHDGFAWNGLAIPVTASLGVATWDGRETLKDLIFRGDMALYKAKKNGRNCVERASKD